MHTEDHKAYLDKIPGSSNPITELSDKDYINYWVNKKAWRESGVYFKRFVYVLIVAFIVFFTPEDNWSATVALYPPNCG